MSDPISELKQAVIVATLRNCRLFSGLTSEDLASISSVTIVKPLKKGEYLFREGDPCHGFYIVQKGAINVHKVNPTGREQVIHIFREGESFAEAAMTMEHGYPADARAEEPSQVLLIQKTGFMNLLRSQPELALRMLVSMSKHLQQLVEQLEAVALKDVDARLANWLLKQCPRSAGTEPVTINLEVPKRVIAAELGTVSETFSRTLAKFKKKGLIIVKGKSITILNPSKLKSLFGGF